MLSICGKSPIVTATTASTTPLPQEISSSSGYRWARSYTSAEVQIKQALAKLDIADKRKKIGDPSNLHADICSCRYRPTGQLLQKKWRN